MQAVGSMPLSALASAGNGEEASTEPEKAADQRDHQGFRKNEI